MEDFPPIDKSLPYTQRTFEQTGEAIAIALLDDIDANPHSRIPNTEYGDLEGVRVAVTEHIVAEFPYKYDPVIRKVMESRETFIQYIRQLFKPPESFNNKREITTPNSKKKGRIQMRRLGPALPWPASKVEPAMEE